ncbi:MAG: beta-glucosidase, partial [Planctomycetota bacterium]
MNDDELLASVQQATFRYFWDFAHPDSGMAREGLRHPRDTCTTGGTGFGVLTIMVGAQRGFVSREAAARRVLKIARFLADKATRYHGAWSHWIHGVTGKTILFAGKDDDGGDIVETAFLVQGLLAARQYFDRDDEVERELRTLVDRLWRDVEWDWYLGDPPGKQLLWHWSPRVGFQRGHRIGGHFNECMIAYVLAIASPTHPIPPDCYYAGWVHDAKTYANGKTFYGRRLAVGFDYGGPLFFTHYSYLGLAPQAVTDRFCNYFDNNRTITLINHAYCADNPKGFAGYGDLVWGLTASFSVDGYRAHEPRVDNGTITPTAAISAMPYTPKKSLATLKYFYRELGARIWGPFGFRDAFNLQRDWVSDTYLAIDQGTIAPMIENHRTGLCWRMFMRDADVVRGLKKAGI